MDASLALRENIPMNYFLSENEAILSTKADRQQVKAHDWLRLTSSGDLFLLNALRGIC